MTTILARKNISSLELKKLLARKGCSMAVLKNIVSIFLKYNFVVRDTH